MVRCQPRGHRPRLEPVERGGGDVETRSAKGRRASGQRFSSFLKSKLPPTVSFTDEQREALFREFLQWREKQRPVAQH